ncbi:MAG: lysophospholipid acyltransferase family protein [Pseudomonadota bacterium]|nr:lysophospholipid acyltransferase family protein [Pseudomonadota bacterium]
MSAVAMKSGRKEGWTPIGALQFVYVMIWTAFWISLAILMRGLSGSARIPLRMGARLWAPGLIGGAGARLKVEGAEAIDWSQPYLVVSNHQSMIDICALFRGVPVPLRFVLKKEMTRVPFVSAYARATGMLFIDRDNPRSAPLMLRSAAKLLGAGQSVCIFPEGTRSRDGQLDEFKAGPFQAAIMAGIQVLPVALQGAGNVLPPTPWFRAYPGQIRMRFGQPIASTGQSRQTLAHEAQDAVQALLASP